MRRVGLYYRSEHAGATRLAMDLEEYLQAHGLETWRGAVDDDDALCLAADGLDALLTLGGDGTIVRAVRCVAPAQVPILGVNFGRLGFLTEVDPEDVMGLMPRLLDGGYRVERRMMLHTVLERQGQAILEADGINDVVVGRGHVSRTLQVTVSVDGHRMMTQSADAMIVASPTGSTAYSLAAGGPIVIPSMRCMVITPVAAHLSVSHSMVVPGDCLVEMCLAKESDATLTVDGQLDRPVLLGDVVRTSVSAMTAGFIRFGGPGYFYETVFRKLRWPEQRDGA